MNIKIKNSENSVNNLSFVKALLIELYIENLEMNYFSKEKIKEGVLKELERLKNPNLFVREKEDTYTGGIVKSYGFRTTSLTRPIIISLVADAIRETPEIINDEITLREALTFIRNEKGRAEAMEGKHDDSIMSYGITLYARSQQKVKVPIKEEKKKLFKWSEDLKQDYYKADRATRERMIEKYGEPN